MASQKIKIGENTQQKSELSINGSKKVNIANKAKELLHQSDIPISDYKAFSASFTEYVYQHLKRELKVFRNADKEALLKLAGIDYKELFKLERDFKTYRVNLNEDLTQVVFPDFNIYATSKEQIERYNYCIELGKMLNKIDYLHKRDVITSLPCFDNLHGDYKPNIQFVLHGILK